ncbi:UDP-N-acetylglucosamine--N-acetylmuramyl-(pentapeptide) pyrophosphoryl-undecaprenol N-acetylglucosamine transferase [Sedimentisphaera cyanobacteriorum]|uniref:UDP-N-acetylglucosamine--N-acetylmuramyl-(pentapeptide) pyrophosphoryl-undecaprenol N-acetylglucosamine transferase n=1 Tax=Sedimentisphaera cyanobacteriorum TaxID=1940790 RepID=A0A1Q2HSJ7_9BACT|nr:UDP-N-acetylglucosamine--N-acetylmuramyl-(pentapeptide) pyrophosphoryl-undecaprenol N-acetylglucosamine transferase [Sedimentisphaera cyanobacteriorum]AQQ10244.1 UDP-N-acetylglucosamine--N-acetylmuramyl-(pentapeptide) pyrophosphoryl-undecaprenol N-acetylglucosamine transferase [Sedimentisphaera cyanobacteriorum]
MSKRIFFAGGGTGGHIYPSLAVAEAMEKNSDIDISFFCSERAVDSEILGSQPYSFYKLPAKQFGLNAPFAAGFLKSISKAVSILKKAKPCVVAGCGGFVSAPVLAAAKLLAIPSVFINIDIIPGRANRLFINMCREVYLQFEDTLEYFDKGRVAPFVTGCPLRSEFAESAELEKPAFLSPDKKLLLISGASSGALSINKAMCLLAEQFDRYARSWQITVIAGRGKADQLRKVYEEREIEAHILEYTDQMPALLANASLAAGRSGALSVAEYAFLGVPVVCIPYPYHKDQHQLLNARKLQDKGAALIAEDCREDYQSTADNLSKALFPLMEDQNRLEEMKNRALNNCQSRQNPAELIAERIISL